MSDPQNTYGYNGDYDQYKGDLGGGHTPADDTSNQSMNLGTDDKPSNQDIPPVPLAGTTPQNMGSEQTFVAPPPQYGQVPPNPYGTQYGANPGGYAPYPYAQQGQTGWVAIDEKAQKLAYWGIGLAAGNIFFGVILFSLVIPFFLVPLMSIAGIIVSRKSTKIQKNHLATVAFWLNIVSLVVSALFILVIFAFLALLVAGTTY